MPTKNGVLRSLVDQKVQESNGNKRQGYARAAEKLDGLMQENKLSPSDFSFKQMFEELVEAPENMDDIVSVSEAVNSSAFPTIASKVIHRDIIDEYDLALGTVGDLVRRTDASRSDEELVVGFEAGDTEPLMRRQGMAYEETDFGEKDWKIKMADFGRIISLTRETIFEDRTGEVLKRARDIGRAAGHQQQKVIVQTIQATPRDAFQETTFGGAVYKGQALNQAALYSSDHSALDGQVNDNLLVNPLTDWTNLDAVWQAFAEMVNEAGDKISVVPKTVLVPMALKATAFQIMNSQILGVTGSTDKTNIPLMNPIRDMGSLNVVSSVFMDSSTDWYVGDFDKQLLLLDVFKPETASQGTNSELAFSNQIIARFRFSYHYGVGHTDWRYILRNTAT